MAPALPSAQAVSGQSLIARAMGMAARRAGETIKENPFQDLVGGSAWLDGWMDAVGGTIAVADQIG